MEESTRQKKFGRLIQRDLGEIFLKDKRGIIGNSFITVAHVKVSPDLSVAKVFISMMLEKNKDTIIKKINSRKSEIRKILGNQIGKQVRVVPELIFFIDEIEENAERIETLIDSLNIPPPEDQETESDK